MERIAITTFVLLSTLAGPIARADAPANDDVASAAIVPSLPFGVSVNMREATFSSDEPTDCVQDGLPPLSARRGTIWFAYTATSDAPLAAMMTGYYGGMGLAVYRAAGDDLHPVGCRSDDPWLDEIFVVFAPVPGDTYLIQASKGKRSEDASHDVWFGLRHAPTMDFAVTDVRPLSSEGHPRYRDVEVDVASRTANVLASAGITLWGCSTALPERCSVLRHSNGYHLSSSWCTPCTDVVHWDHTFPPCVGTITLKVTVEGFGTVDPDASNDSRTTLASVAGPGVGAGTCAAPGQ